MSTTTVDPGFVPEEHLKFAGQDSFFGGEHPLDLGVGYFVVLGFGLLFSVLTTVIVYFNNRFGAQQEVTSEHFKYVFSVQISTFKCTSFLSAH
jgi:hypothetical protein